MDRFDTIKTRDDVIQNIKTLYSYLSDGNEDHYQWAIERLKKGKNYVVEIIDSHAYFAPSRFVGYKDNTIENSITEVDITPPSALAILYGFLL